jgi:glycosyltransferase involved in cell wall biosynthesis
VLTALLATHNGAHVLARVLDAYTRLQVPEGGWKLVVVDNASTDKTPDILESFRSRLPLTIVHEARRGKNVALNAGLAEIEGDIVVFTDDDALAPVDWLVKWRRIADHNPSVSIFGGKILPHWEATPPEWVLEVVPVGPAFAITPPDLDPGPVNPGMIWGPNMLVRANIFAAGNRFNEAVGPGPGNYIMGSETEFNRRIAAQGHNCEYFPVVEVHHIIRTYQFEENWLLGRAFRHGKQSGQISKSHGSQDLPYVAGFPRWMLMDLMVQFCSLIKARISGNFSNAFKARWRIKEIQGYFAEFR